MCHRKATKPHPPHTCSRMYDVVRKKDKQIGKTCDVKRVKKNWARMRESHTLNSFVFDANAIYPTLATFTRLAER